MPIRDQDYRRPATDALTLRNATVTQVNNDQTVNVSMDGVEIIRVPCLVHVKPAVGMVLKVAQHRRALIVLGTLDPAGRPT